MRRRAGLVVRGTRCDGGMQGHRRELYRIAQGQRGLVTRADLRSLGVTRNQRASLTADGTLTLAGRNTYVTGGSPPDAKRAVMLAALDVGGRVSHRTGTALHGITGVALPTKPDVLIARTGKPNGSDVATVHTTTWLPPDDLTVVDGIPCTSVARCLFNLAGLVPEVPLEVVKGAVDDAIHRKLASDPWLWWRLEKLRCRGRNGVAAFEAILTRRAEGEVTESWLEREFLALVRAAGAPIPVCQRRIRARGAFLARVDFLYEALGIVVEVTGEVAHSTREQRAHDATRRNHLAMEGFLVLEFTYDQIVGSPVDVIEELWRAISTRGASRRAPGA